MENFVGCSLIMAIHLDIVPTNCSCFLFSTLQFLMDQFYTATGMEGNGLLKSGGLLDWFLGGLFLRPQRPQQLAKHAMDLAKQQHWDD